jgi:hypothetical protein
MDAKRRWRVLDDDREFRGAGDCRVIRENTVRTGVPHVRRQSHDRRGASASGVCRELRRFLDSGRGDVDDDRSAIIRRAENRLDDRATLLRSEDHELAGQGRYDEPVYAGAKAKLDLGAQRCLVDRLLETRAEEGNL